MTVLSIDQALHLAQTHLQSGRLADVESICRSILQKFPQTAEAYRLLALVACQVQQRDMAVDLLRQAIALNPRVPVYHDNLSFMFMALKRADEAEAASRTALALDPTSADAHHNLGVALEALGRAEEAEAAYRQALALRPTLVDSYYSLGNVLMSLERREEAEAAFRQTLELQPTYADAANNLGIILAGQGRLTEAEAAYRQALAARPQDSDPENNLGMALHAAGRLEEALACYRQALAKRPSYFAAHSNAVYCEQFRTGVTLEKLARVHAEWDERHARPMRDKWRPLTNAPDPNRRLRLGFVSADFRRHPVGYFFVRGFEALAAHGFETVCYSDRSKQDEITTRIHAAAGTWRETHTLMHRELADVVRADRIDILFDLAGHLANNRLITFALKPAPIQVTWIGYMGTTGLAAMDYLLADRYHVPEAAEKHYREKILRLPDGFFCYDPPNPAPEVGPLPALRQGHVTLGSFNIPAKMTPEVIVVWADILRRLPGSRLLLKFRGLGDPGVRRRFAELFAAAGVNPSRIDMEGWSPHAEHLAAYHRIDMALDPFPFSGSTTTCEALWMGVPVVTCPGETFASRHSLSYLSNVGLTETIATNRIDYIERAVALAGDLPRLAQMRAELRDRMARSPMCDAPRFASNLANVLSTIWRDWCAAQSGRASV